ncbi:YmaF family protein [Clostridium sardiniense]|uniref:YmaF family protein n=1 Tax=Clostridium sardiniense TaxID=29369 RepID=UPI003D32D8E2
MRSHCDDDMQRHVHEFLGSVRLAELGSEDVHNHRFAGVTGQAKRKGNSHVHKICTRTDFFDHFHFIDVWTGPAIPVGEGRHVHFVFATTEEEDGHVHEFIVATLIEAPIFTEA